jgi:HPt (histidine-containing phosphotransfer) domain-containing protein
MAIADKRSIFARYRKIILAVVLFMVADSLVIGINFYSTFKANESAVSINLSGRQRMLSQRMTKALLILQRAVNTNDETGIERQLKELDLSVGLFDTTLKGFRDGDMVTGGDGSRVYLTQVDTDASRKFVEDAYIIWNQYLGHLRPFLGNNRAFTTAQLETVVNYAQANNLEVLRLMNDLTTDLEAVANERARTLRIILIIGIIVAFANFAYTVVVSIRDLMASDQKIAVARRETEEILSTVHEGLFLLDRNYELGTQFSSSLPRLLHREIKPGMDFLKILEDMVPEKVFKTAADYIELLLGDRVKEILVTSLNPLVNVPVRTSENSSTDTAPDLYLTFFFNRVLVEGQISHLLVTVQDVTERVMLEQDLEDAKKQSEIEVESLIRLVSSDFSSLQHFVNNTSGSLAQINEGLSQTQDSERDRMHMINTILRLVHTIKGEAAALGIDMMETYAHDCEKELVAMRESEEGITGDHMVRITVLLEGFYSRHISLAEIVTRFSGVLLARTAAGTSGVQAEEQAKQDNPVVDQITHLAQRIAKDQDKKIKISCQLEKLQALPENITQELQSVSIQLVRNAVVHGIEKPAERVMIHKPETGALSLWNTYLGNGLYDFVVRDDGRGIIPDQLREHLVKNGHISQGEADKLSDQEIASWIFRPGFFTVTGEANKDAGHGVGLDAVLAKIRAFNGRLTVKSRPNQFTEFHIQFYAAA